MGAYYVNGGVGHAAAVIQALGAWPTLQRPVVSSSSSSTAVAVAAVTASSATSTATAAAAVSVSTPLASPRQAVGDDLQPMTTMIPNVRETESPALLPTPTCTLPSPPTGQIFSTAGTVTTTAITATATATAAATTTSAATVQVSLSSSGKTIISNVIDVVDSIERMIGTTLS